MKAAHTKVNKVLSAVGLKERMSVSGTVFYAYDRNKFKEYYSRRHTDPFITEMDEVYGIMEANILHLETGLRITFLASESYFGDIVEYHFFEVFIITFDKETFKVEDIDIQKEMFYTKDKTIPFLDVDRTIV
jgi:hypothetical protein